MIVGDAYYFAPVASCIFPALAFLIDLVLLAAPAYMIVMNEIEIYKDHEIYSAGLFLVYRLESQPVMFAYCFTKFSRTA